MAYTKPTLEQQIADIEADLFSRFPNLDPALANSFAKNLCEVIAGAVNGNYGAIEYDSKQPFSATASDDNLDRLATQFGESRDAATKADGNVIFTGAIGSQVVTGSILVSSNGSRYSIDEGFTMASASETHTVTAITAGVDWNLAASSTLSFVSTPAGVDGSATVDSGGITGGQDRESDDDLRAKIRLKVSAPPQGGMEADYGRWASEITESTRFWVHPDKDDNYYGDTIPDGDVWLYFAMDDTYANGIPQAGDVTDVQEYINPIKPIGVGEFRAIAPTASDISFDVTIVPDTPTNQANVISELTGAIRLKGSVGGIIKLSAFYEAMSIVPNLTDWDINLINGITPADVAASAGGLHTMGAVSFS